MNKKLVPALLLVLVIAAAIAWFIWSRQAQPPAKTTDSAPSVSRVGADELRFPPDAPQLTMIRATVYAGSLIPATDALSARLAYDDNVTARIGVGFSGRIVSIKAAVGDSVKAGQVLAEIDSPDFGTAYADVNKARADQERKRLAVDRAKELVPGEAISIKDWEAIRADYDQARAETARAENRIKNLNPFNLPISGQRVQLTSPIEGVVTERTASPAMELSPPLPAPLFVVTNPKRLWLMIDLPERLISQVRPESTVSVESDAFPGERFLAKIVQLGQIVDPNSRRVTLRAVLLNPKRRLLPEMFVRAYVLQDIGIGICLPNSAIINQGIYTYVYVEKSPGEFKRQKVTLRTRGGETSCVSEGNGLNGGESIVTTGALLLDAELTALIGDKP